VRGRGENSPAQDLGDFRVEGRAEAGGQSDFRGTRESPTHQTEVLYLLLAAGTPDGQRGRVAGTPARGGAGRTESPKRQREAAGEAGRPRWSAKRTGRAEKARVWVSPSPPTATRAGAGGATASRG